MGQIPNILSCFRLVAAPLLAWLIFTDRFGAALWLAIPIGISDWADGYFARKLRTTSRLGTYLDPAADKVLLVVAFLSLGFVGVIPAGLVALVVGRDLVIVTGVALLWRFRGRSQFAPLATGKLSTMFQIVTVFAVLVFHLFPSNPLRYLMWASFAATAIFTFFSGIVYVRKGIQLAARDAR